MSGYFIVENSYERISLKKSFAPQWPKMDLWDKFLCFIFGTINDVKRMDSDNQGELQYQLENNWYGKVMYKDESGVTPVCCRHGASGWLCKECGEKLIK